MRSLLRYFHPFLSIGVLWFGATACNVSDLTDAAETIEGETIDPDVIESAEGARWIYLGAIARFNEMLAIQSNQVGRFTDEVAIRSNVRQGELDDRNGRLLSGQVSFVVGHPLYSKAQAARVQLQQALQLLQKHVTGSNQTMQAHAYGLLGMVLLTFADNFCSGIPLSDAAWGGEFTPGRRTSTDSIYQRAIDLFDKGIALNSDSTAVQTLLRIGKARALNALGKFQEAATIAMDVADDDSVGVDYIAVQPSGSSVAFFPRFMIGGTAGLDTTNFTVVNSKGQNGLFWFSDDPMQQDMRIPLRTINTTDGTLKDTTVYHSPIRPTFFFSDRTILLASGVEARLIEAEAALQTGDIPTFLARINAVRRRYKMLNSISLTDTTDPGTNASRVNLLFRERAYTFYLTGRRLGDFRRLVRQYGRHPSDVYPTGLSEGSEMTTYGENYVFTPEEPAGRESQYNPYYSECESYDP